MGILIVCFALAAGRFAESTTRESGAAPLPLSMAKEADMKILFVALFVLSAAAFCADAAVLETPTYTVTIDNPCAEGAVCEKVGFEAVTKKGGKTTTLTGKTTHNLDRQGAPVAVLGYEFRSGRTVYFVSLDGTLTITQGQKHVLREEGKWRDVPKDDAN